jgi:hypothetical protein
VNIKSSDARPAVAAAFSGAIQVEKRSSSHQELIMLWTKGWLETRLLMLLSLLFFAINLAAELVRLTNPLKSPPPAWSDFLLMWAFVPPLLAGNGIRTPTRFRASADAHSSMYYTLSLPVSRTRLFVVRAVIGMVEAAAVVTVVTGAIWALLPSLRTNATPQAVVLYVLTLLTYTSAFYFLSVLLATMVEGPWRVWGTFLLILGARWAGMHLPQFSFDILAPIASNTPFVTHALPWKEMGICIGLCATVFVIASRMVEVREY